MYLIYTHMFAAIAAFSTNPLKLIHLEESLLRYGLDSLCFHPWKISVWRSKTSLVWSAAMENPIWPSTIQLKPDRCLALSGVPLIPELAQGSVYDFNQLADYIWGTSAHQFQQKASGTYSVIKSTTQSIIAFSDICARYPLFFHETDEITTIATTPRLIGEANPYCAGFAINTRPTTSLCVHSQLWGNDTLYDGVKLLPPHKALVVEPWGCRLTDISLTWNDISEQVPKDISHYDEVGQHVSDVFRTLGKLVPGKITLGLSGGKDSRLMATAACSAGLKDKLQLFTGGKMDSPEFDIAEKVATALGTYTDKRVSKPHQLEPDKYFQRVRKNVGRYDGMLLPIAGKTDAHGGHPNVEVTGYGGELYRRGISKQFVHRPIESLHDAAHRWKSYHVKPDACGVVLEHLVKEDNRWMYQWVHDAVKIEKVSLWGLPERFFAAYRVPLHQGLAVSQSSAILSVDPLISAKIAEAHFQYGVFAGANELTHCALMNWFEPQITKIPFYNDTWSKALVPLFSPDIYQPAYGANISQSKVRPFAWELFEKPKDWLLDVMVPKNSALYSFVDRSKLLSFLEDGRLSSLMQANQLYTILGLQMKLSGYDIRPKDGIRRDVIIEAPSYSLDLWVNSIRQKGYSTGQVRMMTGDYLADTQLQPNRVFNMKIKEESIHGKTEAEQTTTDLMEEAPKSNSLYPLDAAKMLYRRIPVEYRKVVYKSIREPMEKVWRSYKS